MKIHELQDIDKVLRENEFSLKIEHRPSSIEKSKQTLLLALKTHKAHLEADQEMIAELQSPELQQDKIRDLESLTTKISYCNAFIETLEQEERAYKQHEEDMIKRQQRRQEVKTFLAQPYAQQQYGHINMETILDFMKDLDVFAQRLGKTHLKPYPVHSSARTAMHLLLERVQT